MSEQASESTLAEQPKRMNRRDNQPTPLIGPPGAIPKE